MEDDELNMMLDLGEVLDIVNSRDDEIITIKIRVRRKYLDDANKKLLKLVSENDWL